MRVVTCISNNEGLCFNHRRLSRDKLQIADLLDFCKGEALYIKENAALLFPEDAPVEVVENPLETAKQGGFCLVEDQSLAPIFEDIEELVLYRWNRDYPADTFLELDLTQFQKVSSEDFPGNSHETITREVYRK